LELRDRIALVTGAGRRIGREIALALGRAGCDVVVHHGRSAEGAAQTAEELRAMGRRVWTESADLADVAAIDALFEAIARDPGRLDILVNSAANFRSGPLQEAREADWEQTMAVNLRAPFFCMQRAAALMAGEGRPGGAIVNLGDLSALSPWTGFSIHGASKAGLLALTRAAALELGPAVRVNAVVPGAILPPPGTDAGESSWQQRGERLPVGRTGRPEHVARAVRFVIENDFVTGAIVPVDGGEHLVGSFEH
jgi:NAD(P)-dependent dehydrogenase (short-subunit alcohol dehydrogenase family)